MGNNVKLKDEYFVDCAYVPAPTKCEVHYIKRYLRKIMTQFLQFYPCLFG